MRTSCGGVVREATVDAMHKLLAFLGELDARGIARALTSVRDAVMVRVFIPGERWEVEFFPDGSVEVEVYRSVEGVIGGQAAEAALARLLREDDEAEAGKERWLAQRGGVEGGTGP
jgi:hypothetical protein